jgi:hypothetical protein
MGNVIKELVNEALKSASVHSLKCEDLICTQSLAKAMEYTESMGIEPPQCSLSAKSSNADVQRAKAARMLGETKWWSRRLENQAIQNFEAKQRELGLVTDSMSDELLKYQNANS